MGHSPGQVRMCDTDLHVSQLLHDVAVSGVRESLSFPPPSLVLPCH